MPSSEHFHPKEVYLTKDSLQHIHCDDGRGMLGLQRGIRHFDGTNSKQPVVSQRDASWPYASDRSQELTMSQYVYEIAGGLLQCQACLSVDGQPEQGTQRIPLQGAHLCRLTPMRDNQDCTMSAPGLNHLFLDGCQCSRSHLSFLRGRVGDRGYTPPTGHQFTLRGEHAVLASHMRDNHGSMLSITRVADFLPCICWQNKKDNSAAARANDAVFSDSPEVREKCKPTRAVQPLREQLCS